MLFVRYFCVLQGYENMLFSSQSLVVLPFTFGAVVHLELSFVYKIRWELP